MYFGTNIGQHEVSMYFFEGVEEVTAFIEHTVIFISEDIGVTYLSMITLPQILL